MLYRAKTRIATCIIIVFLLTTIIFNDLFLANGAEKTLTPTIKILTDRSRPSLDENITLIVTITVNEPSNVTATTPIVTGVGDASIVYENNSAIVNPGEMGQLQWVYGGKKCGAIKFNFDLTVRKLSDNSTVVAQSLSSNEISISKNSEFLLVGLIFFVLYVILSSRYDWFKPKESLFNLWGGLIGLVYSIVFFLIGLFTAIVTFRLALDPFLTIALLGSILLMFGLYCCEIHSRIFSRASALKITELTGLSVVLFGVMGFFVAWQVWLPLALLISLGIIATVKEIVEMRLYE